METVTLREDCLEKAACCLRKIDTKVFWLLAACARQNPGEYLSMRSIAETVWGSGLEDDQVKSNVQRAVSEIRNRLSHDVIERKEKGTSYRLDLEAIETWALKTEFRTQKNVVSTPDATPGLFADRLSEVLDTISNNETTVNRLVLWGVSALIGVSKNIDKVFEALDCGRKIQVICGELEARLAVDLLRQIIAQSDASLNSAHQRFSKLFQIVLVEGLAGSGLGWIDFDATRSFLEMADGDERVVRLGRGRFVEHFFSPVTIRISQIEAAGVVRSTPLILIDCFNTRIVREYDTLVRYFCGKVQANSDLLIGPRVLC